jgi:two-component system, NarL family, sensor kinase
LHTYHDSLEELVRRRTEELEERSVRLSEEIADRKRVEEAFREVSRRLYRVRDEEGRRVARELHDSVAQELAAIVMNLGALEDLLPGKNPDAKGLFARTLALAEKCSQEVRTLSYLLHPPLLDQLGLVSALRSYVDGFSKRSGVSIALETPPECDRLPAEVELTLFRVVQESLGNIHRHSGSATACIQLARQRDCGVLEVRDHGCGIAPDVLDSIRRHASVGGVGIAGMQERLRLLNGTLSVESSSSGTTIRAIIPLVGQTL